MEGKKRTWELQMLTSLSTPCSWETERSKANKSEALSWG